ncbi:hypothetical protein ColKHC_12183 [Colletotrichum higginsianum]|nr:hypothetical protein ColKHC_12183 [Colletotrichum higginsianum]
MVPSADWNARSLRPLLRQEGKQTSKMCIEGPAAASSQTLRRSSAGRSGNLVKDWTRKGMVTGGRGARVWLDAGRLST